MRRLTTALAVVAVACLAAGSAQARSGYKSDFNDLYGTAGTALDSCDTCHVYGGKARNPYGADLEAEMNAGATATDGMIAIEGLDSDGDGFTNMDEIGALTFPGDAASFPSGPECTDGDGDAYSVEGGTCGAADCDDTNPAVNPGVTEDCTNGIDDDCDGLVDALDPNAINCPPECTDADLDTYYLEGSACGTAADCDDLDALVNPGAVEDCLNGIDDDCDGLVDGADTDCGGCVPTSSQEKGKKCSDGIDNDCDGLMDAADPDCGGDGDTGGTEGKGQTCSDGIDNDGDGLTDCADPDCSKARVCK